MYRFRRRSFRAVIVITSIVLCAWILRCWIKKPGRRSYRYPKAILPKDDDTEALRMAINKCDPDVMYETAPSKCNGSPLLLLLVVSSPNSILGRYLLRKYLSTVPKLKSYNEGPVWRTVFVISRTNNPILETRIQEEIAANEDIILGRYKDTQRHLVYKTLIGLGWACCSCLPKYLLKVNADVFVNVRNIINWLFERTNGTYNEQRVYMGISTVGHNPRPIRDMQNELFVSKDAYKHDTYAPYILGAAYLISKDVLQKVVSLAPRYPAFPPEDAYFGMLAKETGVSPQHNSWFIRQAKPHTWHICDYRSILVSLNAMPRDFSKMFKESIRSERECMPMATLLPELAPTNETTVQL